MAESSSVDDAPLAMVTGAAGGMGSSFAQQLASEGYDLLLTDKARPPLDSLAAEIADEHAVRTSALAVDLSDDKDLAGLLERVLDLERLDMLINNAGFATRGEFWQRDLTRELEMVHVQTAACVGLCRAALPRMVARGRGDIINVSSVAAFLPLPGDTYAALKSFVTVFSELLKRQLKGTGVHVMSLCPGLMYTGFHDTPDWEGFDRSSVPRFLWSRPEDVARKALKALRQKKVVYVPGLTNRVLRELGRNRLLRRFIG